MFLEALFLDNPPAIVEGHFAGLEKVLRLIPLLYNFRVFFSASSLRLQNERDFRNALPRGGAREGCPTRLRDRRTLDVTSARETTRNQILKPARTCADSCAQRRR